VVLREIDFLLNICWSILCFLRCGEYSFQCRSVQVWIIAKRWK